MAEALIRGIAVIQLSQQASHSGVLHPLSKTRSKRGRTSGWIGVAETSCKFFMVFSLSRDGLKLGDARCR
jgi:hypothetical protein